MKNSIKSNLNSLHLSDIYTLMLFAMYKIKEIPDYAVLSELCYLLDGSNLTRLLTYFAGKTVTFPSTDDFTVMSNAMLLYQYVNIDGESLANAQAKLNIESKKLRDKTTELYLQLLPIMKEYNIDRSQIQKNGK